MARNRAAKIQQTRKEKSKNLVLAYSDAVQVNPQPDIRKKFSKHDLTRISPLTENQKTAFHYWNDPETTALALLGYAGTGKTFLACYFALQQILDPATPYEKLVVVRSAVQSRSIGHLPGELEDKLDPFKAPYREIFDQLLPYRKSFDNMEQINMVSFESTSFLRGTSFHNSIVIFDEAQCTTLVEFETVISRIGEDTRLLICGDYEQNDIGNQSGFKDVIPILRRTKNTQFVDFNLEDIVRSGWVKSYLHAKYGK